MPAADPVERATQTSPLVNVLFSGNLFEPARDSIELNNGRKKKIV